MKSKVPLQITDDEIRAIYAEGEEAMITLVQSLVERINRLEARVETLENQLKKNSHNSSTPRPVMASGNGAKAYGKKVTVAVGDNPVIPAAPWNGVKPLIPW